MRIVFMGTPEFAVASLQQLISAGYKVVAVITVPDKPAGRGQQLTASAVKLAAIEAGIPVLQPEKLKDPDFLDALRAFKPDLAVVVAFRKLPKEVFAMPRLGTFNLHASLLPDYRGAAPINWAVMNGEQMTGLTTFLLDEAIDTGGLLLQLPVPLPESWTAGDLHDHMMIAGAQLVLTTVRGLEMGTLQPVPQPEKPTAPGAPKIFREQCRICWDLDAKRVFNHIRGLSPYPAAWTTLDGKNLKVLFAKPADVNVSEATVLVQDDRVYVGCRTGAIELITIQVEGKSKTPVREFLRGYRGNWHIA